MIRYIGLGAAAVIAASTSAFAADLVRPVAPPPPPPVFNWAGCYVGGFVGGAWANSRGTAQDSNGYNYFGATGPVYSFNLNSSVIAGGTVGCNVQQKNLVFG